MTGHRHRNTPAADSVLSRRDFAVGGLVAVSALGGISKRSRAAEARRFEGKSVTFASWGGAYQDTQKACYCDPFAKQTGATVIQDGPMNEAKLRAMIEGGQPVWDVVDVTHDSIYNYIKNNMLEKLDLSKINVSRIDPKYRNDYGIGDIAWSYNIGYSTKVFSDTSHPRTWADVFDLARFPGMRTLNADGPQPVFEVALMADGVPIEKLYDVLSTDAGVKRALTKLDTIKKKTIFWDTNSQSQQLFIDGEVSCGLILNGRIYDAVKKGGALGIEWNQNIQSIDYLVIPRGSKNIELAHALIDEMTVADNQAKLANIIAYAPTNPAAFSSIDQKIAPWLSTNPANVAQGFLINAEFWRENQEKLTQIYEAWKLS